VFELWFALVAITLTLYVMLDGYDLGAGALHFLVTRTPEERRVVLGAVGPLWDANEVWLLAAGGSLFVAFPRVLASGLSGFYLAIFLVIWCLILRAISIEFRGHLSEPLWRSFWDAGFTLSSTLLPVLLGAALGNVIRGVPLDADGWFHLTLFTTFQPRDPVGILDWYTVLTGAYAWITLAAHGAAFLAWRTEGPVHDRSRGLALRLLIAVAVLWIPVTLATVRVNPDLLAAFPHRPLAWLAIGVAAAGLAGSILMTARRRDLPAFLGSSAWIAGMLGATAACQYPILLRSTGDIARSITAQAGGATPQSLGVAISWWWVGFLLAIVYLAVLFRVYRRRIGAAGEAGY
jgi:cytochrome d ubiquinol oxidase subunit II